MLYFYYYNDQIKLIFPSNQLEAKKIDSIDTFKIIAMKWNAMQCNGIQIIDVKKEEKGRKKSKKMTSRAVIANPCKWAVININIIQKIEIIKKRVQLVRTIRSRDLRIASEEQ